MIFKQFDFEGCLSYVVACSKEGLGAIIDPSHTMDPYLDFIGSSNIKVVYVIDTHTHVDHLSLAEEIADRVGARTVMCDQAPLQRQIGSAVKDLFGIEKIIEENGGKRIDFLLKDGEELTMGGVSLTALFTPGHTRDSMCLLSHGRLFSGDTLLIGQCGRSDLPGGSTGEMYESLFSKIAPLSDDLLVYPAHDYNGNINSSLGYERVNNVCLKTRRTVEEFGRFLKSLFPPLDSTGAKLQCGLKVSTGSSPEGGELGPLMHTFCMSMEQYLIQPQGTNAILPGELRVGMDEKDKPYLLDVRQPEELEAGGHIEGAVNIPVAEIPKRVGELPANLDQPIVTICESGFRSAHAALYLRAYGYNKVKSLEYGMHGWKAEGYPVV